MQTRASRLALALTLLFASTDLRAQGVILGVDKVGLGIGDVPEMTGIRLNFRDRELRRIDGINVTIWAPYQDARRSYIRGVAVGLPVTGGGDIDGLGVAVFGLGVEHRFRGIGLAPIGMGAGGSMEGLMIGGIGLGGGGDITGIGIGGIGVGTGGHMKGLMIGGIGAGSGGDVDGIVIGGIGVGAGGHVKGLAIGGIGVGGGGNAEGIMIGGIGVGVGGDMTGLAVGGIGVGAGGTFTGVGIGGIGVGAQRAKGLMISGIAGGAQDLTGIAFSTAWFKLEKGEMHGMSVASYNEIRGRQRGLTIGLLNLAEELHGVQLGLINIAYNNPSGRKVLPLVNWHD
jgi:hypothetical protein